MDIGPTELLIVLAIVVLFFGPGRLAKIGGELGQALRSFREGIKDDKKTLEISESENAAGETTTDK